MKVRIEIFNFILVASFLLIFGESIAQCDSRLIPVYSNSIKYRVRDNDNRCEGFYESDVSAKLEIVGVTQGRFYYRYNRREILIVSSPFLQTQTVGIRAVGIPLHTFYRMDAQISQNDSLVWPVGDVLHPQEVRFRSIGVFGWIGSEDNMIYVPLKVVSTMRPALGDTTIYIYLRAPWDVNDVKWRFADFDIENDDDACTVSGPWIESSVNDYYAGDRIIVNIPTDKNTPICITATAMSQQGKLSLTAKIYLN